MTTVEIRPTVARDLPALRIVLEETGLFPGDMLSGLVQPALSGEVEAIWLSGLIDATPIGFCYAEPEPMTDAVWNMRALAVLPAHQGMGVGSRIVTGLEDRLRTDGQRLLIVDTSGTDEFAVARRFYLHSGYDKEARIRDFWADGDDKITFRKRIAGPP